MKFLRTLLAAAGGLALLGFQAEAIAQSLPGGTIDYQGLSAASIPTLSEWGLAGLAILIAVVGYRYRRARFGGKPLASLLIAGALGLCAILGDKVIRPAAAVPAPLFSFSNPAGGTVQICSSSQVSVSNTTSNSVRVVNVTPFAGSSIEAGTCVPGLVVAPSASCTIMFVGSSAQCSPG
jgi:hypothetical protein